MNFCRCAAVLLTVFSSTIAFVPSKQIKNVFITPLHAVVTGIKGKPAASREEDLMLTLQVIMDHAQRSTTVSTEQFVQQVEEAKRESEMPSEKIDVSVPYDAAARLAYEASDKALTYEEFEVKYLAEAIELVKSKQPVDLSVPYDATAKLAYDQSDKSMAFAEFKTTYLADAVTLVKSKQPFDVSIPYDAAARLAYHASDRSVPFTEFEKEYKANAVAEVIAKKK